MKKITTLFAVLMLFAGTVMAQQVSVSEAMSRAKAFLQSSSPSGAKSISTPSTSPKLTLAYTCQDNAGQNVCYYIFNSDNSFIIVGGDEAAQQILGYSDNGPFDYDKAPSNLKWWLSQYQQQISSAITNAASQPAAAKSVSGSGNQTLDANVTVEPLLTTTWNQGTPFNNAIKAAYTAQGDSKEFVTGCVATAMAQVMNYNEWPTTGTGKHSYTCTSNSDFTPSVNFGTTTYDWSSMLDSYSSSYSGAAANAVATLMYHAGVSVDMDYNIAEAGGSGASTIHVPNALITYFGYDQELRYESRDYYSDDDWAAMLRSELDNSRPIIYSGQDATTQSGHCFVCDGYKTADGTFHFNWGWSGNGDGWYVVTGTGALKPNVSGTGGAGTKAAYTSHQDIIRGIKKAVIGSREHPHIAEKSKGDIQLYVGDTKYSSYTYDANSSSSSVATLKTSIFNLCATLKNFTVGVRAYNTTNGTITYFSSSNYNDFSIGSYFTELQSFTFNLSVLADGTYEIRPVCRRSDSSSDDDWKLVQTVYDETIPTVTVSNNGSGTKETGLTFSNAPYFSNDNNPWENDLVLHMPIYNGTGEAYDNSFYVKVGLNGGYGTYTCGYSCPAGASDTYDVNLDLWKSNMATDVVKDIYFYQDAACSIPFNIPSIKYTYRPTLSYDYTLSSAGVGTLILPFDAAIPTSDKDGNDITWKAYECNAMNGTSLVLSEATTLKRNTPYIIQGDAATCTFTGPNAIDDSPVLFGAGMLKGTLLTDKYQFTTNDYILQKQNESVAFYHYTADSGTWYAAPYRAFLQTSDITSLNFAAIPGIGNNIPTAITTVAGTTKSAGIYNVSGMKLHELQPGLNIIIDEQGNTTKVIINK